MIEADSDRPNRPLERVNQPLRVLPTPQRRRVPLDSLENVRHEMARVYRAMRFGEVQTQDGSRLIFALTAIGKILEVEQLEKRVEQLESGNARGLLR
jgi:hypothetical protein